MTVRALNQLLRYGEPVIRRAVPLALALLTISNPKVRKGRLALRERIRGLGCGVLLCSRWPG